MLTAMKLTGKPDGIAAYHCRQENYYFKQTTDFEDKVLKAGMDVERESALDYVQVHGKLSEKLGLTDGQNINEATFRGLLNSQDATGKEICRKHKVTGIDLTFSAPKSVSITGLVYKDPTVIQAHDQAVLDVMKEIEDRHAFARPTARTTWHTGKMVYVTARDGFSREHDPHLHTHVVVMNLTEWKGKVMGLWSREILNQDFNKVWGALYRTRLATRLKEKGYNITYTKSGEIRLDKISLELEKTFSTRRQQILEAEAEGQLEMDAWRKTRKNKKETVIDKQKILNDWQEKANQKNQKTEEQNRAEALQEREKWMQEASWSIEAQQEQTNNRSSITELEKWQLAIRRATEKSASASQHAVITEYLTECMRSEQWQDISYKEALSRLEQQVQIEHIVEVEEGRYTSWEMMKADREYINEAGAKLQAWARITPNEASKIIEGQRKEKLQKGERTLSELQSFAVQKMISSPTFLTVVQGDAGSGKTTALSATADFYKERGVEVVGLCMQGVAAKNLEEETGIGANTLTSYLSQKKAKSESHRVIIFDEASMLDSRNAARLFKLAKKNNDRIILVGDRNQLGSISAGNVFERLVSDCERAGDLINLNENFRQRDEELREAVDYARKGKMCESLDILNSRGDITEIADTQERRTKIAELYDKDTLIITGTTQARDEINFRIRFELARQNKINNNENKIYKMVRADAEGIEHEREIKLAKNDVIAFCKNEYKDYDIRNGERGKIIGLDERHLQVELEDKRTIKIDTEKYKNIDYGYALTTYKAQGQTYNKVVVEADTSTPSLLDMRNQYVNITRARDDIKIFTDDKEYLKELAEIKTRARDTLAASYTLQDTFTAEERLWDNIRNNRYEEMLPQKVEKTEEQQIQKDNSRTVEQ